MSRQTRRLYEFGPFRLDPAERQLLREGRPVRLTPKAFAVLVMLVERGGRLVGRGELMEALWPGVFVEEGNVDNCVHRLRKAMGDGQSYIETVPKHGYRFVAEVQVLADEDGREAAAESPGPFAAPAGVATGRSPQPWRRAGRLRKGASAAVLVGVLAAALGVGAIYLRRVGTKKEGGAPVRTIAVLPFANEGSDPGLEYLSDGLSESLIDRLSQLPGVKVVARGSSFKYKGGEADPREVARSLGVEALVVGRVVQRGDELRVRAELVDARAGTQLWGEQYIRHAADIQVVQAEMARTISEMLHLRLTGAQEQQLTRRATQNAQAYRLYLIGLFRQREGHREGFKEALDYYHQAVALDPDFALAFATMPSVYFNLATTSGLDHREAMARAKAAAQKALELDGALAEAHYGLAVVKQQEWDWSGAESEFKRAIELNPNLAGARSGYAVYLTLMGRAEEALAENRRAQELDPFRITFKGNEGGILLSARRYDESVQVLQNVIRMQPDYAWAHIGLGHTYAAKGMYAEAVNEYQTAISLYGEVTNGLIDIGYASAMSGKREEALATLNRLKTSKEYVSPAVLAVLYAGLGDKEAAIRSLERAYSAHDTALQSLKAEPRYDSLRSDPRFQDLVRRVGLAP